MSCHPKLGKTHATLSQTQCLTLHESFGRSRLNSAERLLWIAF
ncbi:hypothetical protein [Leptospira noguchii]|nr:hypothetical protein [Leptospira noguchii]